MSGSVPLIRAAALAPILLWMRARGVDWEARLLEAGLPATLLDEAERPIALFAGIRFFAAAAEIEGPDFGCRVVRDSSIAQLASFGRFALGARTPREAMDRLMRAYPHHSSHEQFVVLREPGGLTVRHWFVVALDDAALHLCHQYVAAMVRTVTAHCGIAGPRLSAVRLVPHPRAGLAHLSAHLDCTPLPATDGTLTISIPDAVLDRPYRRPMRDRGPTRLAPERLEPIRADGSLTASLRLILPGILDDRPARLSEIAGLAGTSARSLQRRLADEGTSLSAIVDGLRRERALALLARGRDPVGSISADLGYSDQSSLTRAMRRWSDAPPSRLRTERAVMARD